MECGRALKSVLADFNVPLIINDHADVCLAVDAEGLHVGQDDLSPLDARAIIGNEKILGLSVSNTQELAAVDIRLVESSWYRTDFLDQYETRTPVPLSDLAALQH